MTTTGRNAPLSERLIGFGGRTCALIRQAPRDVVLENMFRQLARAATSPAANYAEAKESVSTRDYVHKLKICVKELREAQTWLRMAQATGFRQTDLQALIAESDELIAICVTCVRRATGR